MSTLSSPPAVTPLLEKRPEPMSVAWVTWMLQFRQLLIDTAASISTTITDLAAHLAAADPHPQYQKESEKNTASGYAGLSASSKLAGAQQVYGTIANTACEGNDARLTAEVSDSVYSAGWDGITVIAPSKNAIYDKIQTLLGSSAYTPTNVTTDRSYDANATSIDELADVLGTLISDLQGKGILS